jgi:hypothetical protein
MNNGFMFNGSPFNGFGAGTGTGGDGGDGGDGGGGFVIRTRLGATFRIEMLSGSASGTDLEDQDGATLLDQDGQVLVDQSAAAIWEDITDDVIFSEGVEWFRGINGFGPENRLAAPGWLGFSLDNNTTNSAGLLGYYTPRHVNCRSGWARDVQVRLVATYNDIDYVQWRGAVESIRPVPGIYGKRTVAVMAFDAMKRWSDTPVNGIPKAPSGLIDELLQAISDNAARALWLQDSTDGDLKSLDTSSDVLPFAFMQMGGEEYAVSLGQKVIQSALQYLYVSRLGVVTSENRHRRPARSVYLTVTDDMLLNGDDAVDVPANYEGVFNVLRATSHVVTPGADTGTVLYRSPAVLFVEAGETTEFWGSYVDPTNTVKPISGMDFILPLEAGVDYFGNEASDGSGADTTSDLVVSPSCFLTNVKFSVTNNGAARAYLVNMAGVPFLQVRGRVLSDDGPVTVSARVAADYEDRVESIDLPYQGNVSFAQSYATYLSSQYAAATPLHGARLDPQFDEDTLLKCLELEIGLVLSVSEPMTALDATEGYVQSISGKLLAPDWYALRLGMAPRVAGAGTPWLAGVVGRSEAGVTTFASF